MPAMASPPGTLDSVSRSPPGAFEGAAFPRRENHAPQSARRRRPPARSRALASGSAFGSLAQVFPLASGRAFGPIAQVFPLASGRAFGSLAQVFPLASGRAFGSLAQVFPLGSLAQP